MIVEHGKVEKYQNRAREIRRLWKTSTNVIPIIAVASLDEYMSMLGIGKKEVAEYSSLLYLEAQGY